MREELEQNVLEPIAHPERFTSLGLDVPAGVLFFGPPGYAALRVALLMIGVGVAKRYLQKH